MRGRAGLVVCAKAWKPNALKHNKTKKIFLISESPGGLTFFRGEKRLVLITDSYF
jgi:hypothetical protein